MSNTFYCIQYFHFFHLLAYFSSTTSIQTSPTIGDWAFFVAASRIWNSLPSSVTASDTRHLQAPAEDTSFRWFPLPNSTVPNLRCTSSFCNVDWCTVFLKFFLLNDTLKYSFNNNNNNNLGETAPVHTIHIQLTASLSHHTSKASPHYLETCKCQETSDNLKEMSCLTINFNLI